MSKNIHKNISKNFIEKNSQMPFDHANQSATDALKTASKRAIIKTAEATGVLTDNKVANKIEKFSNPSP